MGERRCRKVGHVLPRNNAWWQLPIEEHAHANTWLTVSCRGPFRRVDWEETMLRVGSLAGDEDAGKSSRKKLSTARGYDGGGDFRQRHNE